MHDHLVAATLIIRSFQKSHRILIASVPILEIYEIFITTTTAIIRSSSSGITSNINLATNLRRYSQFEDEDDVDVVVEHLVQADDVLVRHLHQQVHLLLDVGQRLSAPRRRHAPLPDELGGELGGRRLLAAAAHHGELAAGT